MTVTIFVYGTLQEDDAREARLHGMTKRTDSHYPTIEPDSGEVVEGQLVEKERYPDAYEQCDPNDPDNSLYWRFPIGDTDVHVYVGNPDFPTWNRELLWDTDYTYEEAKAALADAELIVP